MTLFGVLTLIGAADCSGLLDFVRVVIKVRIKYAPVVRISIELFLFDRTRVLLKYFCLVGSSFCEVLLFRVSESVFLLVLLGNVFRVLFYVKKWVLFSSLDITSSRDFLICTFKVLFFYWHLDTNRVIF